MAQRGRPTLPQLQERAQADPIRKALPKRVRAMIQDPSRPLLSAQEVIKRHTLGEISKGAGISKGMLSMMWHGKRSPSLDLGLRLALFLGLDPFDLCAWLNSRRPVG